MEAIYMDFSKCNVNIAFQAFDNLNNGVISLKSATIYVFVSAFNAKLLV